MGKLSRLLLSRRAKTKRSPGEYSQIGGGLVCLISFCPSEGLPIGGQGNTRVISQTALDHFRTSLSSRKSDPYSVLLRRNKLPMALLDEALNPNTRKVGSCLGVKMPLFILHFSVPILSRLNLSAKPSVPRLRGNGLE
jgi:NGP1NT (NUC091) domain